MRSPPAGGSHDHNGKVAKTRLIREALQKLAPAQARHEEVEQHKIRKRLYMQVLESGQAVIDGCDLDPLELQNVPQRADDPAVIVDDQDAHDRHRGVWRAVGRTPKNRPAAPAPSERPSRLVLPDVTTPAAGQFERSCRLPP